MTAPSKKRRYIYTELRPCAPFKAAQSARMSRRPGLRGACTVARSSPLPAATREQGRWGGEGGQTNDSQQGGGDWWKQRRGLLWEHRNNEGRRGRRERGEGDEPSAGAVCLATGLRTPRARNCEATCIASIHWRRSSSLLARNSRSSFFVREMIRKAFGYL